MTQNPGIAPIRISAAVIQNSHWTIFKTLDLETIARYLDNNINQYFRLRDMIYSQNESRSELLGLLFQIESFMELTKDRLKQIMPSKRFRRGLINPLGSIVKLISGNLDNNDAMRYNSEISQLKNKEHSVERKLTLMQKAFDKLVNISDNLKYNLIQLNIRTSQLQALQYNQSKIHNIVSQMNSLYQILNNFRTIHNVIQDTETAIAFSRIHILHQSIINSTELFHILLEIEKHYRLVYTVGKDNLTKLESTIVLKSFSDNKKLVFVLEVPLLDTVTYNYYKIIPIPIYNPSSLKTSIIIPKYPYLMVNGLKYRPVSIPCEQIEDDRVLCKEDNIVQYADTTCIEQIMLLKNYSACHKNFIQIEDVRSHIIADGIWLLFTKKKLVLTENCNNEVMKYNLKGTFLIFPNRNCETQIGDKTISKVAETRTLQASLLLRPVALPELQHEIKMEDSQVDLRGVDLNDIKDILNSAKYNSESVNKSEILVTQDISVWTISIIVIMSVFTLAFFVVKFKVFKKMIVLRRNHLDPKDLPPADFSLRGGGVKDAHPVDICFVSPNKA